ncbi:MAG: glycosyl transferase [Clostridiales bacterium]|nr:glycosyl transferase [Clostridiales bacterium]
MIPKVIHYCWFGGNPKNELIEMCIASWKEFCPDYEVIEWNESNYDVNAHPFMKKAYEAKRWAFVSDYARIDILDRYGGIYLDTDVELLKSLDPLLEDDLYAGFESVDYVSFGQGVGSVAGHPVLKEILAVYDGLEFSDHAYDLSTISACPIVQTNALKKHGLVCNGREQRIDGCHIYDIEVLCPMSFATGETHITDRTVSIHHFDMSWYSESRKRDLLRQRRYVKRFGPTVGKALAALVGFPEKLASHAKDGELVDYVRFLFRRIFGRRDGE